MIYFRTPKVVPNRLPLTYVNDGPINPWVQARHVPLTLKSEAWIHVRGLAEVLAWITILQGKFRVFWALSPKPLLNLKP